MDEIFDQHPNAEITLSTHLDPGEQDRSPVIMNNGKHMIVFPPFPYAREYGCFHMKVILIRFADRLRVVISSSNLYIPDWTEFSQSVWMQVFSSTLVTLQDFFFVNNGNNYTPKRLDVEFQQQLKEILRFSKCPEDRIVNLLENVCFRNVSVRLVISAPNVYNKRLMGKYGHLRLREIIRDLNAFYAITNHPVTHFAPILSLCSSVGSPSLNWLQSILASCNGGMEYPEKGKIEDFFHLVFPTTAYVENSRIGAERAGSLIFSRKAYNTKTFPKQCLKRYKDVKGRENSLPHAKCRME